MDGVDNSKLKEMMVVDPDERSEKEQELFLNEFKNSTFLMAFNEDGLPACLVSDKIDHVIVPLFTDLEELEKIEMLKELHHGWIKAELIEDLLFSLDKVDEIVINPISENAVGMEFETFLTIFIDERLAQVEKIIKVHGEDLSEDSRFYLREEKPKMKENAVNEIYTSEVPFLANFKDDFNQKKPYVNILIIPKGTRFLSIGRNDRIPDTVFAPTIKFKLVEENDKTLIWECISQELKYPINNNKIIYLIIAIIIIILIITFIRVIL